MRLAWWQTLIHRLAQALTVVCLVLVVAMVYRHQRRYGSFDPATTGDGLLAILLTALLGLLLLAVALFRPETGRVRRLRWTAAAWSAAILAALVGVWSLIETNSQWDYVVGTPLLSERDVAAFLADHTESLPSPAVERWTVPTGVFVQSFEFLNANNVQVAGYVWQHYDPTIPADISRGVILPESVEEAYELVEAYRVDQGGTELVGWYFAAILRQSFDYRHYPFDRQDIWLRLWHPNAERGVLLVPDFAAYQNLDPRTLPGLERQFVYGGWDPAFTGFSYALNSYNTTFGFATGFGQESLPELYFNLGVKRSFLNPFVDHVAFALAIAVLLFGILILTTNDEDLQGRFGLNTAGVVGACSGLLFAVILEHNQIRNTVTSQQIAYLESLPFILYAFIVLVAVNAILLASPLDVRFFEYKNNTLPLLLYWPLLLGALFVITLGFFYV